MKKYIALFLCVLMLMTLCACGDDIAQPEDKDKDTTTTTTVEVENTTASTGGDSTTGTTATVTGTDTTTTTVYVPSGVTVPVGTRPTSDTTSTTGTTATVVSPSGSTASSSGSTTTTTTTTTAQPTEPTGPQRYIILPAVGSDIDVSKKKDRIHVSSVSAFFEESGEITVTLTFKNNSSQWITEETDYILYTCYAEDGSVVQRAQKLSIGCIDTKSNKEKSYTFTVPADTTEVRITKSSIVYWTEWA